MNEADEQGLNDQDVDLCCEILKILFNLSLVRSNMDEVRVIEIIFFSKLVKFNRKQLNLSIKYGKLSEIKFVAE